MGTFILVLIPTSLAHITNEFLEEAHARRRDSDFDIYQACVETINGDMFCPSFDKNDAEELSYIRIEVQRDNKPFKYSSVLETRAES